MDRERSVASVVVVMVVAEYCPVPRTYMRHRQVKAEKRIIN